MIKFSWLEIMKMPSVTAFGNAFGIKEGKVAIDSCELDQVKIGHEVVKRFRQYRFPIALQFVSKKAIDKDMILFAVQAWLSSDSKMVLSQYGNPYKCTITDVALASTQPIDPKRIDITAVGHGQRILKAAKT